MRKTKELAEQDRDAHAMGCQLANQGSDHAERVRRARRARR